MIKTLKYFLLYLVTVLQPLYSTNGDSGINIEVIKEGPRVLNLEYNIYKVTNSNSFTESIERVQIESLVDLEASDLKVTTLEYIKDRERPENKCEFSHPIIYYVFDNDNHYQNNFGSCL